MRTAFRRSSLDGVAAIAEVGGEKTVGASGSSGSPRELVAQLAGRRLLLVLDNLEQISGAD